MEQFLTTKGKREVFQEVFMLLKGKKIERSGTVTLFGLLVANPLLGILYIVLYNLFAFFQFFLFLLQE